MTSDVEVVGRAERRPPWEEECPVTCDHEKAYTYTGPMGEVVYVCVDCGLTSLSPREFKEVRDDGAE